MDIQIKSEDFDEPDVGIVEFLHEGSKIEAAIKYRHVKQKITNSLIYNLANINFKNEYLKYIPMT